MTFDLDFDLVDFERIYFTYIYIYICIFTLYVPYCINSSFLELLYFSIRISRFLCDCYLDHVTDFNHVTDFDHVTLLLLFRSNPDAILFLFHLKKAFVPKYCDFYIIITPFLQKTFVIIYILLCCMGYTTI